MKTDLSKPFFSIIIPVYRDLERLVLCLKALNHSGNFGIAFEVIVVNNDPEIKSLDLSIIAYSNSIRVINENTPGSYTARNRGIQEANGVVLAFTDSDCLPSLRWLQTAYEQFEKDFKREIGVLTGPVGLFYKNPNFLSDAEIYEKYTGFTTEAYAKEGHAITANWFSYKSVIDEFGGFDSNLKSNGDSELSAKISQKYQIVYCPELVVQHPSRYHTPELVSKYRRILGGTYSRKYNGKYFAFLKHILVFILKRHRFSLKKFFTVPVQESWAIFKVCNAVNLGALKEYFNLVAGGETKR
ncbi:MAG: glycosyltransferase family 2 protein [Cyclobacteriaceae bacterium]